MKAIIGQVILFVCFSEWTGLSYWPKITLVFFGGVKSLFMCDIYKLYSIHVQAECLAIEIFVVVDSFIVILL